MTLIEALAQRLEMPREVTPQVLKHLSGTYGVTRDNAAEFFRDELARLEEYEIDLLLASLFTPKLEEQAAFAELLGRDSILTAEWPSLVAALCDRPTIAHLVLDSGTQPVVLQRITIERYVNRLRLDGTIDEPLFNLIKRSCPAPDQPLLKAIARRATWRTEGQREILQRFLENSAATNTLRAEDSVQLLAITETYDPEGIADLLARIPHWEKVLEQQIEEAKAPKRFLDDRIQEMHGGGRDQRMQDEGRIGVKKKELAFLQRLRACLTR